MIEMEEKTSKEIDYKALWQAVYYNDMSRVVQEVEKGADVNKTYSYDNTLLHFSLNPDITTYLISKGADVNAANEDGDTPLHKIAKLQEGKYKELISNVHTLLVNNADTSIENNQGWTPLMCYLHRIPSLSDEIIETFLNYETDVKGVYHNYETLLIRTLIEESPNVKSVIDHGGNFTKLARNNAVLKHCALRQVTLEEFKWIWDIYQYKESWDIFWSILNFFMNNGEFSKFDYVIQSDKLKDVVDLMFRDDDPKCPPMCPIISAILEAAWQRGYDKNKAVEAIYILLSNGYVPLEREAIEVHQLFGYCPLFKLFLHLPVQEEYPDSHLTLGSLIPKILLNPDRCVKTLTNLSTVCQIQHIHQAPLILSYIFNDKVIDFTEVRSSDGNKKHLQRLRRRKLSSLLELSRNQVRLAIWNGYKVENRSQFYTVVRWMKIPQLIKDIITFQRSLYNVYE